MTEKRKKRPVSNHPGNQAQDTAQIHIRIKDQEALERRRKLKQNKLKKKDGFDPVFVTCQIFYKGTPHAYQAVFEYISFVYVDRFQVSIP